MSLIVQCLRYLLSIFPISIRKFIVKQVAASPIGIYRFITYRTTCPIGDERKWIHHIEQSTWKGEWIAPDLKSLKQAEDTALNNDLVILYTHGGGFCIGHALMYMESFQLIINHLRNEHNIRASILSLEYSLSPEHVWPKAQNEAMDAYRYLTDTIGIPSSKIILAGDSAGGNLAATILLTIKSQKNLSMPAGAALISPWVDLSIDQPSFATYPNDFLDQSRINGFVSNFIPNFSHLDEESKLSMIRNPLISPLFGNFRDVCPIFLSYGDIELLRASIENFRANLKNDGVSVTTLKGENALHIWLIFSLVASSKRVYERDCKTMINWMASICTKSAQ